MAKEVGDYLTTFFVTLLDLVLLLSFLKITNKFRDNIYYFVITIWLFLEIFILIIATYIYFFESPNVQYTAVYSIYESEILAHDKAKAYLFLLGILLNQSLKLYSIIRIPIFNFFKKK